MARVARLGVVIDSSGAKKGAQETSSALDSMSKTAQRTQKSLVDAMKAIGVALGIREVVQLADSWTRLEGRLKTVTNSAAELASVQSRLVNVANATRTGLEETISLYTRLARSGADLGLSQAEIIRLTEVTAKTLTVSGATAASASGALLQLAQALGGGIVRAEEFNSILEGTPVIVQEVAKSMGLTTSALRKLVIDGNVSSREFADALLAANGRISESFDKLGPTVDGALTQLSNAFAEAIGRGDQAGGTTRELARAISDFAAMVRDNQDAFNSLAAILTVIVDITRQSVDAFIKAGAAVDDLGRWIDGAAKATEGLANLDVTAWTEGLGRMEAANNSFDASIRRIGAALTKTREEQTRLSAEGQAYLNRLTGARTPQLSAQPFGLFGGLSAGTTATTANSAATRVNAAAMKEAQEQAEKLRKAREDLKKTYEGQWVQLGIELAERAAEAEKAQAEAMRESAKQLSEMITKRAVSNAQLQAQVSALLTSRRAYDDLTDSQEQLAAMNAALAEAQQKGVLIGPAMLLLLGEQVAETQRLVKLKQALLDLDGKSPFTIPVEETKEWGTALTTVANTARDIAQIFGNVGTEITRAVQLASQLVSSISAANKAAAAANAAKGTPGEGAANAASRSAGLAAGASIATVAVTAISMWANATRAAAEEARQMAIALREARVAALTSAKAFVAGANSTPLQKELDSITASFNDVVAKLLAAGAPRVPGLASRTAVNVVPTAKDVNDVIEAYDRMIAAAKRASEFAAAQAEGELQARGLAAVGRTAEAESIRQQLKNEKELEEARLSTADATASAAAVERLRGIQAAEASRRAAEQARDRAAFGLGLAGRRQTLNGDTRGALVTQQTIASNSALAQAQQLLEAGTITAAMFEELKRLLGDEMVAALAAFDNAAQQAKQTILDDLNVRALVAQGRNSEADQARIAIANAQELEGVTDKSLRAQIEYVQGLEAVARAAAAAAETQAKLYDIDTRMIDALRVLDPAKAEALENARRDAERTKELDAAGSKLVRTRLEELYAMQDAAVAQAKLTAELERQKKAAEDLANFTSSVEGDYLRATGRTFDADVKALKDERDKRLQEAKDLKATQETIGQINAIFDSKYNALVAAQLGASAPAASPFSEGPSFSGGASGDSSITLGEDTTAVRSARSITEATALQLVDYAASQTALLRRLVQLAEGGSGPTGNTLTAPSLDRMDRMLGVRANDAARLIAGRVR